MTTVRSQFPDRVEYRLNGLLHREDGPAVEWCTGLKAWYRKGSLHRKDGPAIEWENGDKEWYLNGKNHRLDGPAVKHADGTNYWWLNDRIVSKEEVDKLRCQLLLKGLIVNSRSYKYF
jgi:hypothetical protein